MPTKCGALNQAPGETQSQSLDRMAPIPRRHEPRRRRHPSETSHITAAAALLKQAEMTTSNARFCVPSFHRATSVIRYRLTIATPYSPDNHRLDRDIHPQEDRAANVLSEQNERQDSCHGRCSSRIGRFDQPRRLSSNKLTPMRHICLLSLFRSRWTT